MQRIYVILFAILIGTLPLLSPSELGEDFLYTPAYLVKFAVSAIGVSLLLFLHQLSSSTHSIALYPQKVFLPVAGFILWTIVTLFWVVNFYAAFLHIFQYVVYALTLLLVLNVVKSNHHRKWLLNALVSALFLVSMIGLLQYYLPDSEWIQKVFFQVEKPSSTFTNKNLASHFLVMTIPIVLALLLSAKTKSRVALYAVVAFMGSWFLIYTTARQAYVAVAVQVLLLLLFFILDWIKNKELAILKNIRLPVFKFASLVLILVLLFGLISYDKGMTVNKTNTVNTVVDAVQNIKVDGNNPRFPAWMNTIEMIKDNWVIGVGVGQWRDHYPLYHDRVMKDALYNESARLEKLHNEYLEVFSSVGLIGFGFLLWLLYLLVKQVVVLLSNAHNNNRLDVLGMAMGLIGFGVVAIFSFPLYAYLPGFIVVIYIGLIFSVSSSEDKEHSGLNIKNSVLTKFFFLVLFVVIATFSVRFVYAEHYFLKSISVFNQQKQPESIETVKKAMVLNQYKSQYAYYYAAYLREAGREREAIPYFLDYKASSPYNSHTYIALSEIHRAQGHTSKEQEVLESLLAFDPRNFKALSRLVYVYSKLKDNDKASNVYKKMRNSFVYYQDRNGFGPYHKQALLTAIAVKDYEFAQYVCDDLLKKYPTAENLVSCGVVEYQYADKSKAESLLIQAIKKDNTVKIPAVVLEQLKLKTK